MSVHLQRDLDRIHRNILSLSAMVEEMIDKAALGLRERSHDLANELAAEDKFVDQQEVALEEECLKMLALHQPVAMDLRRIITVVKVNNDLERIADLAVNIVERAKCISDFPEFSIPDRVGAMVAKATQMVRDAMNAFVTMDTDGARNVLQMDDEVDELNVELIEQMQIVMQQTSHLVVPALHCFSAIRHVERIGDLATNIAEDVIYLVEGEIVRHRQSAAQLS